MGLSSYAVPDLQVLSLVPALMGQGTQPFDRAGLDRCAQQLIDLSGRRVLSRENARSRFEFAANITAVGIQAAANAQALVESAFVHSVGATAALLADFDPGLAVLNLTGGFTLNCPTNTALKERFQTLAVNPLPGCGDTGISIGAGVAAHKLLDLPMAVYVAGEGLAAAFPPLRFDIAFAAEDYLKFGLAKLEPNTSVPEFIAAMVLRRKILCVFRGRSEVGPRALGRRSIVARADDPGLRDRINRAKGRETWRPLAPMCRAEDYAEHFEGDAHDSRFMLFTHRVKRPSLHGVTHVDGSARAQAITAQDPWLHPALALMREAGEIPVIVNTSFNCAGEPIVETAQDAFRSFSRMGFDYLVTELGIFVKASG